MHIRTLFSEKYIHAFFDLSLWFKGFFAVSEIIVGIATYVVTKQDLLSLIYWAIGDDLATDPHDLVANTLLHYVQNLSISGQNFAAFYLLSHGIIKLWIITGLLRGKLFYYPAALVVFGLFIVYQIYRYSFTHSVWLLVITAFDMAIVALTWHEYKVMKKRHS